ncbi:MAG TPA: hypothetical protein DDW23_07360 [Planctomycetes bacterium]|nr:hypothetical protein [Planctomycetota bacterium]
MMSNGPLEDITVLEFGNFVAGPTAGQLLTDLGANVIKIEPPMGEPWRHASPSVPPGESRLFIALNRGKKSVCIDLKSEEGQKVCHDIVSKADAVISNNRKSTSEKLKYDYKSLSKVNPKLVYVESTAYGSEGEKAAEPGFDLIMQAYTGIMSTENKIYHGAPSAVRSSSYIDYSTGYAMALGVVSGVHQARITGKGVLMQTSLLAQALSMQAMQVAEIEKDLSPGQKWIKAKRRRPSSISICQPWLPASVHALERCRRTARSWCRSVLRSMETLKGSLRFHAPAPVIRMPVSPSRLAARPRGLSTVCTSWRSSKVNL